jgi:protoheme ferro-lyase
MKFSSDIEMQKIPELTQEFFEHVLYDEEPLFISDEATVWDLSMATAEELIRRISQHYEKPVSVSDLAQPLWKLIRQLNEGLEAARQE